MYNVQIYIFKCGTKSQTEMSENIIFCGIKIKTCYFHLRREPTLRGSTVVIIVASIKGLGLLAVSSMSDCHCLGSPTNFCSCSSKSV